MLNLVRSFLLPLKCQLQYANLMVNEIFSFAQLTHFSLFEGRISGWELYWVKEIGDMPCNILFLPLPGLNALHILTPSNPHPQYPKTAYPSGTLSPCTFPSTPLLSPSGLAQKATLGNKPTTVPSNGPSTSSPRACSPAIW